MWSSGVDKAQRGTTRRVRLALLGVALCALLLLPLGASAHTEGIMQLAAAPAGPYNLTVWTSPDPATTNEELHVAIAVVLADDASPVLDADVLVQLTPEADGPVIEEAATIENSDNKFLHEAVIQVDENGAYQLDIFVEEADGASGSASFPLVIEGGSGLNWVLIVIAVAVVSAAVILILRYRRNPELASGGGSQPEDGPSDGN